VSICGDVNGRGDAPIHALRRHPSPERLEVPGGYYLNNFIACEIVLTTPHASGSVTYSQKMASFALLV
jgi:hypothetical protein